MPLGQTTYDEVPYPSAVFPQTHPNRLAVIAELLGLNPAPPDRCRVLEVGCGDGLNLIALAHAFPQIHVEGFDLAASAIQRGLAIVRGLGLSNVRLTVADLLDYQPDGVFDYIIAHGLFSWVPEDARRRLLDICQRALAPQGVAFISYNALPGFHARRLVRDALRFHTAHFTDPKTKIEQAQAMLTLMLDRRPRDEYTALLCHEAAWIVNNDNTAVLFHDDLAEINEPFLFQDFMARAERHGLQFLAEADFHEMSIEEFPPRVSTVLRPMNVLQREQYMDFLKCRRFRQTLLVHAEAAIDRALLAERLSTMLISTEAWPDRSVIDLSEGVPVRFRVRSGASMTLDQPWQKAAFSVLQAQGRRPVPFDEIISQANQLLNRTPRSEDAVTLTALLLQGFGAGLIELHRVRPRWSNDPGEKPRLNALARWQLEHGEYQLTSLRPAMVRVSSPSKRHILRRLDGQHDRDALERDLARHVDSGQIRLPVEVLSLAKFVADCLSEAAREALLE